MEKQFRIAIGILILVALWIFYPNFAPLEKTLNDSDAQRSIAEKLQAKPETRDFREAFLTEGPNPAATDGHCLNPSQFETHPMFMNEAAQTNLLSSGGPQVDVFRGHTREQVLSFADQNDSAAMVVLGAMAMMRGRGEDESRAFDYLYPKTGDNLRGPQFGVVVTESAALEYQTAYDWFYKAALHGRLIALSNAGEALNLIEPNPIKQGWITREDYDALPKHEKFNLNASSIYNTAMAQIAGNPTQGVLGMFLSIQPRTLVVDEFARHISQQFEIDRNAAELPPIFIPKSTMPPPEELIKMVCKEYWPKEALEKLAD